MTENPQQPYGAPGQQPYGDAGAGVPQQPGSKYGTAAYNPGAVGQEMAEPKGLGRLRMLTLVSLGVYVVSSIVGFILAGSQAYLDAQLDASAGLGIPRDQLEETLEASQGFVMVVSVVTLVIAIAVYLLVYFGLRGAKNWARILGTVFAALGTLLTLFGLIDLGTMMSAVPGLGTVTLVLIVAFVAVNIWWVVTAFSKDVNAYIRMRGQSYAR